MKLDDYQKESSKTASFSGLKIDPIIYLTLGLSGESGEVTEKIKKVLRNNSGEFTEESKQAIKSELGDVLWYLAQMSLQLGFSLEEVAKTNLEKLASRKDRGVIKSEGDNR